MDHGTVCVEWTHRESHPRSLSVAELASSCWTMSPIVLRAEAVGLEPTSGASPPPVFKTGSSSGRMTSVLSLKSSGSWNRTNDRRGGSWFRARRHYQQQLPRNVFEVTGQLSLTYSPSHPNHSRMEMGLGNAIVNDGLPELVGMANGERGESSHGEGVD